MLADQIVASVRHHWWLFLLRGLAAILFGVVALMWPGATVVLLTAFIAAYALVDGVVAISAAVRMRSTFDRWWVLLVQGIISAVFGVWAFINPLLRVPIVAHIRLGCSSPLLCSSCWRGPTRRWAPVRS